jgi:hypothetical protein
MDQTLINIALTIALGIGGVVMGAIGWFARTLWDRIQEHSKEIADIRVKLAAEYVSNSELANAVSDIKDSVRNMTMEMKADIGYIRNRLDGLPQRRQSDPSV